MRKRRWSGTGHYYNEYEGVEYEVEYDYEGYYDPGCTYGPSENCYPPEGEHEISNISITPKPPEGIVESLQEQAEKWSRENESQFGR